MSESSRRKFLYRGKDLEELRRMSMKEFIKLLPSRQRRSLLRGMPKRQKKLLKKLKKARKALKNDREVVTRTHNRDMIIFPEFIGIEVKITPDHIGKYLGEYSPTCKKVSHGNPGVGATRSSQFVPLK